MQLLCQISSPLQISFPLKTSGRIARGRMERCGEGYPWAEPCILPIPACIHPSFPPQPGTWTPDPESCSGLLSQALWGPAALRWDFGVPPNPSLRDI